MRPMARCCAVLILAALLAGCAGARPRATAPGQGEPAAPPAAVTPATDTTPPAPAAPDASNPAQRPPLPTGPCTPEASAVDMPAGVSSGITLKRPLVAPSAAHPWLFYLAFDQPHANGTVYAVRSGGAPAPAEAFVLQVQLSPAPTADWLAAHLTIEGVQPASQSPLIRGDAGGLQLGIPAGQAGESFRVTVRDVVTSEAGAGDVSVTFCRSDPPRATLLSQGASGWQPVPSQLKAGAPLTLRVAFTAPMDRPSVEGALRQTYVEWHNDGPVPRTARAISDLTWVDDRTVAVTFPQPPSPLALSVSGARASSGLFAAGDLPYVYLGEPAYLEAVNPVTGQGRRLLDLPVQVEGTLLSPDGRWLLLTVVQLTGGRDAQPRWQRLLYDLTTGQSQELPQTEWTQALLPGGERVSAAMDQPQRLTVTRTGPGGNRQTVLANLPPFSLYLLSPDGSQVALFVHADTGEMTDDWRPYRLVIASTDGKSQTTLPEVIRVYQPGKDGLRLYWPVWSPDSRRLAFAEDGPAGVTVRVADLVAGHVRTLAEGVPGLRGHQLDPISWSADGRRLQVGRVLFDAETGRELLRLADPVGEARWSPDGAWLALPAGDWTALRALPLAGGQPVSLGEGWLVGWTPEGQALIIRWAGARDRVIFGI